MKHTSFVRTGLAAVAFGAILVPLISEAATLSPRSLLLESSKRFEKNDTFSFEGTIGAEAKNSSTTSSKAVALMGKTFKAQVHGFAEDLSDKEARKMHVIIDAQTGQPVSLQAGNVHAEMLVLEKDMYVKLGMPELFSTVKKFGLNLDAYANQWVVFADAVAKNTLTETIGFSPEKMLGGLVSTSTEYTAQQKEVIRKLIFQSPALVVRQARNEKVDGVVTNHLVITLNKGQLPNLMSQIHKVVAGRVLTRAEITTLRTAYAKMDMPTIDVWIGTKDLLPHKIAVKSVLTEKIGTKPVVTGSTSATLVLRDYNNLPAPITPPVSAQAFSSVLDAIAKQMSSSTVTTTLR